jgi:glycosyltransferase involved in cell wall biosynthesis
VVTPFYNTAAYLGACIESVLSQTYLEWEYLLVNNRSTDGSDEVARAYAASDPRIRLLEPPEFLDQVANYNRALEYLSPDSRYCKIVQADDLLFESCLERMVGLAEQHPTIGVVGAYFLDGGVVYPVAVPFPTTFFPGPEVARLQIERRLGFFGSPTNVMYRSDLVRARRPFFTPGRLHEDTEVCFDLMMEHDFGFVHQLLTFSRERPESTLGQLTAVRWQSAYTYSTMVGQAQRFLPPADAARIRRREQKRYFEMLGRATLRRSPPEFWERHRAALAQVDERFSGWRRLRWTLYALMVDLLCPRTMIAAVGRWVLRTGGQLMGATR